MTTGLLQNGTRATRVRSLRPQRAAINPEMKKGREKPAPVKQSGWTIRLQVYRPDERRSERSSNDRSTRGSRNTGQRRGKRSALLDPLDRKNHHAVSARGPSCRTGRDSRPFDGHTGAGNRAIKLVTDNHRGIDDLAALRRIGGQVEGRNSDSGIGVTRDRNRERRRCVRTTVIGDG